MNESESTVVESVYLEHHAGRMFYRVTLEHGYGVYPYSVHTQWGLIGTLGRGTRFYYLREGLAHTDAYWDIARRKSEGYVDAKDPLVGPVPDLRLEDAQ